MKRKDTEGGQRLINIGVSEDKFDSKAIPRKVVFDRLSGQKACDLIEAILNNDEEMDIIEADEAFDKVRSLSSNIFKLATDHFELVRLIGVNEFSVAGLTIEECRLLSGGLDLIKATNIGDHFGEDIQQSFQDVLRMLRENPDNFQYFINDTEFVEQNGLAILRAIIPSKDNSRNDDEFEEEETSEQITEDYEQYYKDEDSDYDTDKYEAELSGENSQGSY